MVLKKITALVLTVVFSASNTFGCSGDFSIAWAACEDLTVNIADSSSFILWPYGQPDRPSEQELCQQRAFFNYLQCINEL